MAYNISKATTKREIVAVNGVSEELRRRQGINLSGGHVNCIEFCEDMFKMPTMEQMLGAFLEEQNVTTQETPEQARSM